MRTHRQNRTGLAGLATLVLFAILNPQLSSFAQGTAFTYQGRLNDNGNAANGIYDLRFTIYATDSGGIVAGGPVEAGDVSVSNGLFTVTLDFGANVFSGVERWLEIGVRPGASAGTHTNLAPRQKITAAPYAMFAGGVSAAGLTGTVADNRLSANIARLDGNAVFTGAVVFSNAASQFTGSFAGNGAGVTNVNLATLNSQGAITPDATLFSVSSSPGVGALPVGVVTADVNGDGKQDAISANFNANSLTVVTNNGSGGFTLAAHLGVGVGPRDLVAVDVNGDGRVDLISANFSANTLSVMTNNGSGGFGLASSPIVGINPNSVTTADVNGDGKADLISANTAVNSLSVLTNNGQGGFTLSSSPGVGAFPTYVVAADVNGDHRVDLISANRDASTLSVLTNNGSGGLVLAASPVVGAPYGVAAADVNGDGRVDLISANTFGGSTLTVLTNNGGGGFLLAATPAVGLTPFAVVVADVNGDGRADLISANRDDNTLSVLTNGGSGSFVMASSPAVGNSPLALAAADFNGDGRVDLVSANLASDTLSILLKQNLPFNFMGNFTGNLGTTGTNALEIKVNNQRALRIEYATNSSFADSPNIVGGYSGNIVSNGFVGAVIGGGGNQYLQNRVGHHFATVVGGIGNTASGFASTAMGNNNTASGGGATAMGYNNTADGLFSTAMGYNTTASGFVSTAMGYRAQALNTGVFVWADLQDADFASTTTNQFLIRAQGGVGINTTNPGGAALAVNGRLAIFGANVLELGYGVAGKEVSAGRIGYQTFTAGALDIVGAGTAGLNNRKIKLWAEAGATFSGSVSAVAFNPTSDRNVKENFTFVDSRAVLEKVAVLPISQWNFKQDTNAQHIGPMAQDFRAAFGTGDDDKHIATVDADGVALAAIQGLNQKLTVELKRRDAENAELTQRLEKLEKIMNQQNEGTR